MVQKYINTIFVYIFLHKTWFLKLIDEILNASKILKASSIVRLTKLIKNKINALKLN